MCKEILSTETGRVFLADSINTGAVGSTQQVNDLYLKLARLLLEDRRQSEQETEP